MSYYTGGGKRRGKLKGRKCGGGFNYYMREALEEWKDKERTKEIMQTGSHHHETHLHPLKEFRKPQSIPTKGAGLITDGWDMTANVSTYS